MFFMFFKTKMFGKKNIEKKIIIGYWQDTSWFFIFYFLIIMDVLANLLSLVI